MLDSHTFNWLPLPSAIAREMPVRAHPLAVFNEGECGAWISTLQALRAMPAPSHPFALLSARVAAVRHREAELAAAESSDAG